MNWIVEDELEILIETLKDNKMKTDKANNFISFDSYEDDYSHNEIEEFQSDFKKEAAKYLKENYNGQYVIFCDWCVHIVPMSFYEEKELRHGLIC